MENLELAPSHAKVFGVGLSRTGTTSLHYALGILGYRSLHFPPPHHLRELLKSYDAAVDTPVACVFKELAEAYPDARFILTVRDMDSWLASTMHFFSQPPLPEEFWRREVRMRIYGALTWDRQIFTSAYCRHLETVMEYFSHRPNSLLQMNIIAGDGWSKLCPFLGLDAPLISFPNVNKRIAGESARSGPADT